MTEAPRLSGKIAVVTGAGNGIGKGCALMFARHGATVIGCDLDRAALDAAAAEAPIEIEGGVDLTDQTQVQALIGRIGDRHGRIDVLVNAAAIAVFDWIDKLSLADWRRTLSGELDVVFLAVQAAWPLLKASGAASIVNFASANAYHALDGSPALAHCAGKGGVLAMTRQIAMEGATHNIRANTISPGFIRTAATARISPPIRGSNGRCWRGTCSSGSASPRTSPGARRGWRRMRRATSLAPTSRSTAAPPPGDIECVDSTYPHPRHPSLTRAW